MPSNSIHAQKAFNLRLNVRWNVKWMSPEVLGTIWAAKTEGGLCRKSRGRVSVILECVTFINTNAETSQHDYLWSKTPLCSSHFLSTSRHIQINPSATRNEWKSLHELSMGKDEILDCVSVFDWVILTVITGNTLKRIMLKLLFTSKRSEWLVLISQMTRNVL